MPGGKGRLFSFYYTLSLWLQTLVFMVPCDITFQVCIYILSYQLSSQLLKRKHVFHFSLCHMASCTVLVKHTHVYKTTAPQNTRMRKGLGWSRPQTHGIAYGKEESLVNTLRAGPSESLQHLASSPAQSGHPVICK